MDRRIAIGKATTRRGFLGRAAGIAACAIAARRILGGEAPSGAPAAAAAARTKPNSVFDGVRIGCITYSYRGQVSTAEDTLKALLQNALSEVELMGGPIVSFIKAAGDRDAQLVKAAELRKMYNDAGVNIHICKTGFGRSDEDIEFNFRLAKALGCTGITTERNDAAAKKLAPFADKHKIWIGFHNHTGNVPVMDKTDPILDYGRYIGFNFDIGHYFAGTKGKSPVAVLEKYRDRIVSLHLKDRTAQGGNLPWGQGQTPIKEVLQLMRKEKWTFPADIELEYRIPPGSNAVAEVGKCVQYCREALA